MFKAGDTVRWMCPLDHDYTYGEILSIKKGVATVKGIGLYKGITAEVHLRYIQKVTGGRNSGSTYKGCGKRSAP